VRPALALIMVAACGSDVRPKGPITADVTHYDYTFDLTSLAAHAKVTAKITVPGDCWTVPFRAADLANPELNKAAAASATVDSTSITVCGEGYETGETLVLDADLTVTPGTITGLQVGYSTKQDADGGTFTYMLSWVGGCDRFGPCDSAPDKFATYTFDLTHDAGTTVRCPGDITDVSATETLCDFEYDGGPTYSTFAFAAETDWTQTDLGMWGDMHVTIYDRPSTGIAAKVNSTWNAGYVTWLESQFGPYPYGTEMRLLTAPTIFGGFEHPGNIVLIDNLAKVKTILADYVQHTIDHEIAHMWAGDQTTIADTWSFVWKEAMVEYLASTWEDMNDPANSLKTRGSWKSFAANPVSKYFPVPAEHPPIEDFWSYVYGPGPLILFRQLEVMTSRDQVLAAIKDVLGTPRALTVDELITALEQHTGITDEYFDAWLKGTGAPDWPKFDVTFTAGSGTSSVVVHQVNAGSMRRGCKFHVELDGANVGEAVQIAVDTNANGIDQTLQLATPAFTVTAISLDPLNECLIYPNTLTP
jgi:aminopeptidase N